MELLRVGIHVNVINQESARINVENQLMRSSLNSELVENQKNKCVHYCLNECEGR